MWSEFLRTVTPVRPPFGYSNVRMWLVMMPVLAFLQNLWQHRDFSDGSVWQCDHMMLCEAAFHTGWDKHQILMIIQDECVWVLRGGWVKYAEKGIKCEYVKCMHAHIHCGNNRKLSLCARFQQWIISFDEITWTQNTKTKLILGHICSDGCFPCLFCLYDILLDIMFIVYFTLNSGNWF